MNKYFGAALALAAAAVVPHAAQAATAQVAVSGGAVVVTPSTLVLPGGDRAATYSMATRTHVIDSIDVPQMRCTVAADGANATCTRADGVKGKLDVTIVVKPAGGANLPSPNIYIQAN